MDMLKQGFVTSPAHGYLAVALSPHAWYHPSARNEIIFMIILDVPSFFVSHIPLQSYRRRVIV